MRRIIGGAVVAAILSIGLVLSHVRADGVTVVQSRRTAPDGDSDLVYTFDETASPFVSTGRLTGATYNLAEVTNGGALLYGYPGVFNGPLAGVGAFEAQGDGAYLHGPAGAAYEPAYPVTISGWFDPSTALTVYKTAAPGNGAIDPIAAPETISLGIFYGLSSQACMVRVAGVGHACALSGIVSPYWAASGYGAPSQFVCTYDGANVRAYVNGTLVNTCPLTGAIDYATHGDWYALVNAGAHASAGNPYDYSHGSYDDIRIERVVRSAGYISQMYTRGIGQF